MNVWMKWTVGRLNQGNILRLHQTVFGQEQAWRIKVVLIVIPVRNYIFLRAPLPCREPAGTGIVTWTQKTQLKERLSLQRLTGWELPLPFLKLQLPLRKGAHQWEGQGPGSGGAGEAGFCSPLTPWLEARPPPFHSAGGFDLISLSNRHTLVDNSGRHQNPSTSPSSACSLQKLQALLMGPGQVCSISWGLGYSVSSLSASDPVNLQLSQVAQMEELTFTVTWFTYGCCSILPGLTFQEVEAHGLGWGGEWGWEGPWAQEPEDLVQGPAFALWDFVNISRSYASLSLCLCLWEQNQKYESPTLPNRTVLRLTWEIRCEHALEVGKCHKNRSNYYHYPTTLSSLKKKKKSLLTLCYTLQIERQPPIPYDSPKLCK